MQEIFNLFPKLSTEQKEQFAQLGDLYRELNAQVNVISRKDIDNIYKHHVLHSLFSDYIIKFKDGSDILDLGTGGGFPGVPLAIMYPNVNFLLVDGTRKKIGVAQEVIKTLGLQNVEARHQRAEDIKGQKFDFVVCRAVATVDKLITWARPKLKQKQVHAYPNGLLTWKGGNPKKEINLLPKYEYTEVFPLSDYTEDEYFEEKYILYVQG